MITLSNKSEILIQSVSEDIEMITKRIFAIRNVFYFTSDLSLRKRLSNEYAFLCTKFADLKDKVFLFEIKSNDDISYSSILLEKYSRCEKLIINSNLFLV